MGSRRFVSSHSRLQLFIGVGRPYQGLHGLQMSLAEGQEASTIAQAGGGDAVVQHIDELGVKRILLGWYASETFAEFARTLLGPLMKIDNNNELLSTLETFLDCESSPTETAAQLNIHRNTVLNRMERARAALSVDLNDPEERLAVQLACRVRRVRGRS
jgi:DNA-binding PucR family transcriptional regulator